MIAPGLFAGVPIQNGATFAQRAVETLQLAHWYDWSEDGQIAMLWRCGPSEARNAKRRTGLWLLGNEPEREEQSNTSPQEFVAGVRQWQQSRSTPIALPGVLLDLDGIEWIEAYLADNGPIPDFWHVHIYAWNIAHWLDLWEKWEMTMHSYRAERPTIISECACWSEKPDDQIALMEGIATQIIVRPLIHSAFWFSAHYGTQQKFWRRSDLLDGDGTLTAVGQHFLTVRKDVSGAAGDHTVYIPSVAV